MFESSSNLCASRSATLAAPAPASGSVITPSVEAGEAEADRAWAGLMTGTAVTTFLGAGAGGGPRSCFLEIEALAGGSLLALDFVGALAVAGPHRVSSCLRKAARVASGEWRQSWHPTRALACAVDRVKLSLLVT